MSVTMRFGHSGNGGQYGIGLSDNRYQYGSLETRIRAAVRRCIAEEIERLLLVLDGLDVDADYEEESDAEEDGDAEPILAHPERHPEVTEYTDWLGRVWRVAVSGGNQTKDGVGYLGTGDDGEDGHDGREPDESGYGDAAGMHAEEDGEVTLGATEEFNQNHSWPKIATPEFLYGGENEPSLGWRGIGKGCDRIDIESPNDDREEDAGDEREPDEDREPILGWTEDEDQTKPERMVEPWRWADEEL